MKNHILVSIILIACISCNPEKDHKSAQDSFDTFPLDVPEQNALMTKWENKPVLETRLIDDMEGANKWYVSGIGEMSYTQDHVRDGKRSLRFRTSLRDEEHYRQNRSEWDSFDGRQGGHSHVQLRFDEPQDWSAFNRISFWVYVHPTSMPTYCLYLQMKCQGAVQNATSYDGRSHFVQDLKPGQWNHIMFEIPHLQRDKVSSFIIGQVLRGHNPEEEGIVTYDIDQLEIQCVEVDHYKGWEIAPEKFAFSHVGYQCGDPKIAFVGDGAGDKFQLVDTEGKVVFSSDVRVVENEQGLFRILDFSDYNISGIYQLRCQSLESYPFPIDDNIWIQPVFKVLNAFFCLRCGYTVPGVHQECHKDWQGFYGDVKKIINGGWHDAGDLSQGSWRTAMATLAMMRNLEGLEGNQEYAELADRIRTEIAWGLEWLLKTRFGDGYHMSFSVMRIYTDNEVGTIDDVVSPAKNVPWENFLAAAVQSKAAMLLDKSHPGLAQQSRIAAIEDWQAALASRDKWDQADYREAAWGATSSILLGRMTGDEKYKEHAIHFGNLLIRCQEQQFLDGIPITGYFYTATDRQTVIHNYHAAFEEAPLIALAMLCMDFPDHDDWMKWYSAAVLHSEFFLKRGSQIAAPFNLMPNSVWKKSEILAVEDEQIRTDMLRQFNDGTWLSKDYVLRTFPIYHDNLFHGNTNIQMSSTWALAEASRLRRDPEGMELVRQQFEWILGTNPFGQSLMYGVGYDFAPQFAYCLKDIVGSLPVGMDCMSGDDPYWSGTNEATYKEIWVEPMNRFLGAVSIYMSLSKSLSHEQEMGGSIQLRMKDVPSSNKMPTYVVSMTGTGMHEVEVKSFNAKTNIDNMQIDLSKSKSAQFQLELDIPDPDKPYVVVISIDNNQELRWEIVGSFFEKGTQIESSNP